MRLGNVVAWLGEQAEELGVEIYSGQGGIEVLYNEAGEVVGVATNDVGVAKDGSPKESLEQGNPNPGPNPNPQGPLSSEGTLTLTLTLTLAPTPQDSFERGMELRARATVFAEGCRGSLTKEVIAKLGLRLASGLGQG